MLTIDLFSAKLIILPRLKAVRLVIITVICCHIHFYSVITTNTKKSLI